MKRLIFSLLVTVTLLSSCNGSATATLPPDESGETPATPTAMIPTPMQDTATPVPEPTATAMATPIPPDPIWYWSVDAESLRVVGVNQFGERREFDTLNAQDETSTVVYRLDADNALLFIITKGIKLYWLTPDAMQPIAFGKSLNGIRLDDDITRSLSLVTSNPGHAVFSLTTEQSYSSMPDNGPLFWVDRANLSAVRVDEKVSRSIIGSRRNWFHTSPDGHFLRYISGDKPNRSVHELDMTTGETRTIAFSSGSPYAVQASRSGDVWYFEDTGLVADLAGNQFMFNELGSLLLLLDNGNGLVIPNGCEDNCTVRVVDLFADQTKASYQVPWGLTLRFTWNEITQALPDQSLLIPGAPMIVLTSEPALMLDYPSIAPENAPLFRLTPDGQFDLIGLYNKIDSAFFFASPDGRYPVLQAVDKSNIFIYDAETGKTLMTIPSDPGRDDPFIWNDFYDNGVLVNLSWNGSDQNIFAAYNYETGAGAVWEDNSYEITSCPTLFDDGTLICWFTSQTDPDIFDLIHFDPVSGKRTPLLENVWFVYNFQD